MPYNLQVLAKAWKLAIWDINTPNQYGIEQCGGMLTDVVFLVVESKGDLR